LKRLSPRSARRWARARNLRALRRGGFVGGGGAGASGHRQQLTCIFVNNGVLRKNEFASVQKNLRDRLGLKIVAVDASERFLSKRLAG
jgi:hypothetical protein